MEMLAEVIGGASRQVSTDVIGENMGETQNAKVEDDMHLLPPFLSFPFINFDH